MEIKTKEIALHDINDNNSELAINEWKRLEDMITKNNFPKLIVCILHFFRHVDVLLWN